MQWRTLRSPCCACADAAVQLHALTVSLQQPADLSYIPPDFDPRQHSTLNAYQGKKHALGNRAKDIDKGVLVVRFELPFNIWCGGCDVSPNS